MTDDPTEEQKAAEELANAIKVSESDVPLIKMVFLAGIEWERKRQNEALNIFKFDQYDQKKAP